MKWDLLDFELIYLPTLCIMFLGNHESNLGAHYKNCNGMAQIIYSTVCFVIAYVLKYNITENLNVGMRKFYFYK